MNNPPDDKPKIIIDEDWKSRVEQERAQQQHDSRDEPAGAAEGHEHEIPEASFPFLVSTIYTQAMIALGQIPDPFSEKSDEITFHPEVARHHIDMLEVLQEKTQGNLIEEEVQMMDEILHQLRMIFLAMNEAAGE